MAESNWTDLVASLPTSMINRAITQGFTPPPGGGSFVFAFHCLTNDVGAAGMYVNSPVVTPAGKGGSVRCAIKRGGGNTGHGVMLFCSLQSNSVASSGYLLGLATDEKPARLGVWKAAPSGGLEAAEAMVLSTAFFDPLSWLHIRLDVIDQPGGDVEIQIFRNDLSEYTVAAPTWVAEPGLESIIDDAAGITYGPPLIGGYSGVAFYGSEVARTGFADHVQVGRQL